MEALWFTLALLGLLLLFQRWFWIALFALSGIASAFSVLASIIHFQILGAMGFMLLAGICFALAQFIADL